MKSRKKRIVLPFERTVAYTMDPDARRSLRVLGGIEAVAREDGLPWRLAPLGVGFEAALRALPQGTRLDGVVGAFVSDAWLADLGGEVAAVNIAQASRIRAVPTVEIDAVELGRRAGRHLVATGARAVGFVGVPGQYSARGMAAGLAEVLAEAGLAGPSQAPSGPSVRLREWLGGLERPAAVFCASDVLAREVIAAARLAGLAVPEALAVLGVGDSPVDALLSGVGLSSFRLPWEEVGRAAARLLAAEMAREAGAPRGASKRVLLAPGELIERESTRRGDERDWLVEGVLETLRRSLERPVSVDALAAQAGISRRGLEVRFREAVGCGPYGYLQRLRAERAKHLLRARPELRVLDVARACGFAEQHPFSAAFKKWTGLSPKVWREKAPAGEARQGGRRE